MCLNWWSFGFKVKNTWYLNNYSGLGIVDSTMAGKGYISITSTTDTERYGVF